MNRGYSCIALSNPKNILNIGGVLRAAQNYQSNLVVLGSARVSVKHAADTMKAYRHIPVIRTETLMEVIPYDCVPVAVDLVPSARPLGNYVHPERAFYVFGAEDQTLNTQIVNRCRDVVYIPTDRCMNLAATVNIILYDRAVKRNEWPNPIGDNHEQLSGL